MGFGGIGIWQLLIILAIVVLLFGTKRLSSIGTDLGKAIKGFKNSVKDDDKDGDKESEGSDDETETGDTARNVEDKADKTQADTRTEDAKADDKTRH